MKIIINDIPKSDNTYKGRNNVWQYRKDKDTWTELVKRLTIKEMPIGYTPPKKARVTLTYFFKTKARHDPDNYSGKMILDGIVKAGAIEDDSFEHMELVIRGNYDKENPRTEVEIGEL